MEQEIIPFGKYKDKPIEALASDKKYTEWLLAQDWFKNTYPKIHTIVINNFQVPQDTPEHNKLQGLFLDDNYCIRFAKTIQPSFFKEEAFTEISSNYVNYEIKSDTIKNISVQNLYFEKDNIDVMFHVQIEYENTFKRVKGNNEWKKDLEGMNYQHYEYSIKYCIELKPTVGDDYPTILRQMRNLKANILFIGEYTGVGLDVQQFKKLFQSQGIAVIFQKDIK